MNNDNNNNAPTNDNNMFTKYISNISCVIEMLSYAIVAEAAASVALAVGRVHKLKQALGFRGMDVDGPEELLRGTGLRKP